MKPGTNIVLPLDQAHELRARLVEALLIIERAETIEATETPQPPPESHAHN